MKFVYSEHDQKEIEKMEWVIADHKKTCFMIMRERGVDETDLEHQYVFNWDHNDQDMLNEFLKTRAPVGVELSEFELKRRKESES